MGTTRRDRHTALAEDPRVIGDRSGAALVGADGRVAWLCPPNPPLSARSGTWLLAPSGDGRQLRRGYRGASHVMESVWRTPHGDVRVIDAMPSRGVVSDLVRVVEGLSGAVPMRMSLELRFDGLAVPWLRQVEGHMAAVSGPDAAWLTCPVPVREGDGLITAELTAVEGRSLAFVLTHAVAHEPRPLPVDGRAAVRAAERTPPDAMAFTVLAPLLATSR